MPEIEASRTKPSVLIAGELLVEIMRTEVDRPLHRSGLFAGPFPSGAPAITADALAKWGVDVTFVSAVGEDPFGDACLQRLAADGIHIEHVKRVPGYTTGMAFVSYRSDGGRDFLFHAAHSALSQLSLPDACGEADLIHINGSSLLMHPAVRDACVRLADRVVRSGGRISFDPNIRPELIGNAAEVKELFAPILAKTSYLFPSHSELEWFTGEPDGVKSAMSLLEKGVETVVIKNGKAGAMLYSLSEQLEMGGYTVDEIDPTGAGDCFCAGFLYGMLNGWDYSRTLKFANAAGALAVTRMGPMEGTFPLAEVRRLSG